MGAPCSASAMRAYELNGRRPNIKIKKINMMIFLDGVKACIIKIVNAVPGKRAAHEAACTTPCAQVRKRHHPDSAARCVHGQIVTEPSIASA